MAENLAQSPARDLSPTRDLGSLRARIELPYRSGFNRFVRVLGLLTLLASALGLLAAVAGLPLNILSMVIGVLVSLILIGFSVRPSLRKPKF